ncbi:DedA family protein [Kutzneria sp. CA-103260]|uniref:DedA family protein n=1 Tax=Kutzneria sp. CA-103260 TaxID=2802641 RepID=UPI001BA82D8E|nr:DedA family protein [Kutzneria sp. CA-103260]QUQ63724.1 SNARE associated Golgi protein [Kutzneria sp. CA-103260]
MIFPAAVLGDLSPVLAYAVIFGMVVLESVLLLGPFVPTLGLLLFAGVLAHAGTLLWPLVVVSAAAGVVAGDLLAFHTGRHFGPGLRRSRVGRRLPETAWDRAADVIQRRGGLALLACRFVPIVRTIAPHLAGIAGMAYRRLAPYSVAAGLLWACTESGIGYLAATSYDALDIGDSGPLIAGAVLAVAVLVLVVVLRRRRASRHLADKAYSESASPRSIETCS